MKSHSTIETSNTSKEEIFKQADELFTALKPYGKALSKERYELRWAIKMCYGKHSDEDFSQESHVECQNFFQREWTHDQIQRILPIIRYDYYSFLNIQHLVLFEILKSQCTELTDKIDALQKNLANIMNVEYKQIQTEAKTILDSPIEDGGRPMLRALHQNIQASFEGIHKSIELINEKRTRFTFVSGTKSAGSSVAGFFSNTIFHDELVRLIFDFTGAPAPRPKRKQAV